MRLNLILTGYLQVFQISVLTLPPSLRKGNKQASVSIQVQSSSCPKVSLPQLHHNSGSPTPPGQQKEGLVDKLFHHHKIKEGEQRAAHPKAPSSFHPKQQADEDPSAYVEY